jgi:hypothetical protein
MPRSMHKSRSRTSPRCKSFGKKSSRSSSSSLRSSSRSRSSSHKHKSSSHKHKRKLSPALKLWLKVVKDAGYMQAGEHFKRVPKRGSAGYKDLKKSYEFEKKKAGM